MMKCNVTHGVLMAGLVAGAVAVASVASAATPVSRALPTSGLTQYNLGGGVVVATNTPSGVSSFRWNTGTTSGSISTLSGVSSFGTAGVGN
jgi:hypothetical protein